MSLIQVNAHGHYRWITAVLGGRTRGGVQAALAGGLLSGVRYQAGCIRTWSGIVLAWVGSRYNRAKVSPEPTK